MNELLSSVPNRIPLPATWWDLPEHVKSKLNSQHLEKKRLARKLGEIGFEVDRDSRIDKILLAVREETFVEFEEDRWKLTITYICSIWGSYKGDAFNRLKAILDRLE